VRSLTSVEGAYEREAERGRVGKTADARGEQGNLYLDPLIAGELSTVTKGQRGGQLHTVLGGTVCTKERARKSHERNSSWKLAHRGGDLWEGARGRKGDRYYRRGNY